MLQSQFWIIGVSACWITSTAKENSRSRESCVRLEHNCGVHVNMLES